MQRSAPQSTAFQCNAFQRRARHCRAKQGIAKIRHTQRADYGPFFVSVDITAL